jgi:dihydroorotate dehydrogenase (NAD+) catalytic subunit
MVDLSVDIGNLQLKNPVMTASGTFGYGEEYRDFVDISALGGIIVKGTTGSHREGNPYPRMAETPMGMLNAVGLQNKGVDVFLSETWPRIRTFRTNVLVNVSGSTVEEYVEIASKIAEVKDIPGIELNVTRAVREVFPRHLMVKLSPNVTDIVEIAKGVEGAGADSVSLINTLLGMAIDAETWRPLLSTVTGGLSGPCIKPVALRMVWQVASAVKIPVVGLGGISSATDAVEFLLAGASAVQVGTANFVDPSVSGRIVDGLAGYMQRHNIEKITDIIGGLDVS